MIDLHCHILPAIDDGPAALGDALTLAEAQVRAGVTVVAATPHVSDRYRTEAWRVARGVEELRTALDGAAIPLRLITGAEVDVVTAIELEADELRALTLDGGSWLLLEAPLVGYAPLEEVVLRLQSRGISILLAHPERSPQLQRDPAMLLRLVRSGVRTQVTASALAGDFGRTVRRFADQLVADGLVHTVASDAHDAVGRPPELRAPLERAGLAEWAPLLCEEHPAALLAGGQLPETVELRRRGGGGLLRRLRRS